MKPHVDPIAAQMRTIRQRLGWSLERASEKTGVAAVVIGSWERGERHPAIDKMRPILTAYGYRIELVGPDERIVSATAGQERLVYVIAYGRDLDGAIDCDTEAEALDIAHHMPGSQVGYRVNRIGAVQLLGPGGAS